MLLNWGLLKQPLNWFTILLMVLIAGIAIHLVCDYFGSNPATPGDSGA
jgi:hypothetical protein